jgi:hypothetical protein
MKTKLLFLISSFLCLNLFSQTYLVNDNFEDDALGVLPAGWVIRYNGNGTANQKVVESPVKNGIHSFQVSGSSWAANLSKSVTGIPNEVSLKGWIRAENVASGGRCGLGIGNPSIGSWGAYLARVEFYNGNLITFNYTGNSGGYGTQYVLQAATSQTWYLVKIEANRVTGTYRVYINGELASSNTTGTTITEFPLLTTVLPTSVELYGNSMVYFDDIKLYETTNLVAYYPFNGNANDESGNNHHGTVIEAILTADKDGNANSAYYFDGVNDYIDLGDWENGGAMTFTFWARWDALNFYSRIVDLGNGKGDNNIVVSNYRTEDKLFFSTYNNNIETTMYKSTITLNQWDFYSATVDENGVMTTYKNGQEIQKTTGYIPYLLLRTEQFIGKSNFSADEYFKGAIDELKIYNKALTADEVLAEYNTSTAGINDFKQLETNFYVFENALYFKNNQNLSEIKTIEIFNLMGQQIYSTSTIKKEIPIQHLQKGIYILKVENIDGNYSTLKFIIN